MDLLDRFVMQNSARAWSWSHLNCALILADWIVANGRDDPAASFRDRLDEASATLLMQEAGGLVPIVDGLAASAGLRCLSTPQRGAVGVIGSVRNPERQLGAICDGGGWMVWTSRHGFAVVIAKPLTIWTV